MFWAELANKAPYKTNRNAMHLKLQELQESNSKTQEIRAIKQLQEGWEDLNEVFYHQDFLYIPKIITLNWLNVTIMIVLQVIL